MNQEKIKEELRRLLPGAGEIVIDEKIVVTSEEGLPPDTWWNIQVLARVFGTQEVEVKRTPDSAKLTIDNWTWTDA